MFIHIGFCISIILLGDTFHSLILYVYIWGSFLIQKCSYTPPRQTPLSINNAGQLSLPPTFSTTVALMSFLICLSPLDLSLYSGQNPYLSSHPPWYLKAPGEAHRAVAPQQSECHGHPHSQTVLEPAFLLLLCIFRRLVSPTDPA